MRLPGSRLAAALQKQMADHFYTDKALLLIPVPTGTYDSYNNAVVTTSEVPLDCSFTDVLLARDLEMWKDYVDIEIVTSQLRYTGPAPSKGWHVKLVSRFDGAPYKDERTYEIIGIQNRSTFGWVVALKVVTV